MLCKQSVNSSHPWEFCLVMVNYAFSIITNKLCCLYILCQTSFKWLLSYWNQCLIGLLCLPIFLLLPLLFFFWYSTVRKVCLLDISNSLENSKKNFFLSDLPTHSIELLRELCAWEKPSWIQNSHLITQDLTNLLSHEFSPLTTQCENLYYFSMFNIWVMQWDLNDNLENIQ